MKHKLIIILIIIILAIIVSVAVFFLSVKFYPAPGIDNYKTKLNTVFHPQTEIDSEVQQLIDIVKLVKLERLDSESHKAAEKDWCISNNNTYNDKTRECLFSQQSCQIASAVILKQDPSSGKQVVDSSKTNYLEWHNGKCLRTYPTISRVCDGYGLPYDQGNVVCTDGSGCIATKNPGCKLTNDYCSSKGLDFNSSGLGDCFKNDIQSLAEFVFGTTLTRKTRQNILNVINSCKSNMWSQDCAKAEGSFMISPAIIAWDTAKSWAIQRKDELLKYCSTFNNPVECMNSIFELQPAYWLNQTGIQLAQKMMCNLNSDFCNIPIDPRLDPVGYKNFIVDRVNALVNDCQAGGSLVECIADVYSFNWQFKLKFDKIKKECGYILDNGDVNQGGSATECLLALAEFADIELWITEEALTTLSKLICSAGGGVSQFCNLTNEILRGILKFGDKIISALLLYGIEAVKAVLNVATNVTNGAIDIINDITGWFGIPGISHIDLQKSLTSLGALTYQTLKPYIYRGSQYINMVAKAIWTTAEQIGPQVAQYVCNVIIAKGIEGLRNAPTEIVAFFGDVGIKIADVFKSVGGEISDIGNQIGNDIENGAKDAVSTVFSFL